LLGIQVEDGDHPYLEMEDSTGQYLPTKKTDSKRTIISKSVE